MVKPPGGLKVSRNLHAGYLFEGGGTQLVFDPIFENPFSINCHAFPNVSFHLEQIRKLRPDAIFISHYHDDHCSFESLNILDRKIPLYVFCLFEELLAMLRELGFEKVYPIGLNETLSIGCLEVTARRALDAEVDSIFEIQYAGIKVLNVVDSWIDSEVLEVLARKSPWDLVLWPFQTMRELEVLAPTRAKPASRSLPPEWLEQLKLLKPKNIVPSSCQFQFEDWSWYNQKFFPISYAQFQNEIESNFPKCKVLRLNPSESVVLQNHKGEVTVARAEPLLWMQPIGNQNVDYPFTENLKAPKVQEIARHFPELSCAETKRIDDYCRLEIPARYLSIERGETFYFSKPRVWRLVLYSAIGSAKTYNYLIQQDHIQLLTDAPDQQLSWLTEISSYKLYCALEKGEGLTSLYLRINDCSLSSEIEKDLLGSDGDDAVDMGEDPLIRCLYTGVFGAYQRAQLRKLIKETIQPIK